jgi:hypothetical protein
MRYLLITYLKQADGKIDEAVTLSSKIRNTDLRTVNVIMDFKERKVDKCFIDGQTLPKSWENLYEYYEKIYPNLIKKLEDENKEG